MTIWDLAEAAGCEPIEQKTGGRGLQRLREANDVYEADNQVSDSKHAHHNTQVA